MRLAKNTKRTHQSSLKVPSDPLLQTPRSQISSAVQLHIPGKTNASLKMVQQRRCNFHCKFRKCNTQGTSSMMKNSSPGSPCTTIFWLSSNCTGSRASATVRRSHLSSDSGNQQQSNMMGNNELEVKAQQVPYSGQ